jgi:hypothetical protein
LSTRREKYRPLGVFDRADNLGRNLADSLAGIIRNRTHQGAAFPGHFLLLIIFTSIVITFPRLKKAFRDEGEKNKKE